MESPHEVLGVEPDADDDELEAAYRRRVMETHPDHGGSPREFQLVRAAYQTLTSGEWEANGRDELADGSATGDGTGSSSGEPASRPPSRRSDPAREADPGVAPEEWTEARVEYLDYEVLADHGWDIDDEDLFERAREAGVEPGDYGQFLAQAGEPLLESAEGCGFTWPYSCRGGACANCAVSVVEGDLEMPLNHVLSEDLMDRGVRLSCIGVPTTEELKVVYNVKHLPDVEDLLLPPGPFREAHLND
jgi:curved DNA-binding protein CbpA